MYRGRRVHGPGGRRTVSWPRLLGAELSGDALGPALRIGLRTVPSPVINKYRGETCLKRVRSHG